MIPIPSGRVTFLFTDIEGSTNLWENHPDAMQLSFARHEAILRKVIVENDGYIYKMIGDAFQAAFQEAISALKAAYQAQRLLNEEQWGDALIRVRMALHTAYTEERGDDYIGPELNRLARLLSSGYGGQTLLSLATFNQVSRLLPVGWALLDLGEHRLKDLIHPEHIYQLSAEGINSNFPPLKTIDMLPHSLRFQPVSFFDRDHEIEEISRLLLDPERETRLVTLVGLGGVGKTRLSMQLALNVMDHFPQGVFFVDLVAASTLEDLVNAISTAVKLQFTSGVERFQRGIQKTQLYQFLANKKILLILDNFEKFIQYANWISELLEQSGELRLLITSRERLNLVEEWVIQISGLPFPDVNEVDELRQYPAVLLFIDSAKKAGLRNFNSRDLVDIVKICRLVEGIPLGLELAAAWVKMYSLAEIAMEIERNLDFLGKTLRGLPERHQTLRAAFEYSWNLLSKEEAEVFRRLSVFRGGFTLQAGLEITGASPILLSSLLDKSLIRRAAAGRFFTHEILVQYTAEKLDTDQEALSDTRSRHAYYFAGWFRQLGSKLVGGEQMTVEAGLRAEARNFRLAWQWLVEKQKYDIIRPILPTLILTYEMFGPHSEGYDHLRLLVNQLRSSDYRPSSSGDDDLVGLSLAGFRHLSAADQKDRNSLQVESVAIADRLPSGITKAYIFLLSCTGPGAPPLERVVDKCHQCIDLFDQLNDIWGKALALLILGDALNFGRADAVQAGETYREGLAIFTQLNNSWGRATCLHGLAILAFKTGRYQEALEINDECIEIFTKMNNQDKLYDVRAFAAEVAKALNQFDLARSHYEFLLTHVQKVGDLQRQAGIQEKLTQLQ